MHINYYRYTIYRKSRWSMRVTVLCTCLNNLGFLSSTTGHRSSSLFAGFEWRKSGLDMIGLSKVVSFWLFLKYSSNRRLTLECTNIVFPRKVDGACNFVSLNEWIAKKTLVRLRSFQTPRGTTTKSEKQQRVICKCSCYSSRCSCFYLNVDATFSHQLIFLFFFLSLLFDSLCSC